MSVYMLPFGPSRCPPSVPTPWPSGEFATWEYVGGKGKEPDSFESIDPGCDLSIDRASLDRATSSTLI